MMQLGRFTTHQPSPLSRRAFVGAGAVLGALLAPRPAHALRAETIALPGAIPERDGVLSWRLLTKAEFGDFTQPAIIPAEVMALAGQPVTLEGYALALDEAAPTRHYVLMGISAHCPLCVPGGMGNVALVELAEPVALASTPVLLSGTFEVKPDNLGGPVYKISHASIA